MPSYRVTVDVLDVLPGHAPPEVMATVVEAVRARYLVEDTRLDVVAGVPVVNVRFSVPSSSDAEERIEGWAMVDAAAAALSEVAVVARPRLTRRTPRGRWYVVSRPGSH